MKALVTGATGHVGVNLCERLLAEGYAVTAISRRGSRWLSELALAQRRVDIRDPEAVFDAVGGHDVVFHLAARISIDGDPDGEVRSINVDGTQNVASACLRHGVQRLVHMSSFATFDCRDATAELDESAPSVGSDAFAYDRSKAAAERAVDAAVADGLSAAILNPTGILGPADPGPSAMGATIDALRRGRLPALVRGGTDWVDVRDVVAAAVSAVSRGGSGERYLLSGAYASFETIARAVAERTGARIPPILPAWVARFGVPFERLAANVGRRPVRLTNEALDRVTGPPLQVSYAKAARDLGFAPRPLRDTLADTVEWFAANPVGSAVRSGEIEA